MHEQLISWAQTKCLINKRLKKTRIKQEKETKKKKSHNGSVCLLVTKFRLKKKNLRHCC